MTQPSDMPLSKIGGRRFLLTVGCGIICSFLLWDGKLTDESFRWIILGTVAAYITGGTSQKIFGDNHAKN